MIKIDNQTTVNYDRKSAIKSRNGRLLKSEIQLNLTGKNTVNLAEGKNVVQKFNFHGNIYMK